MILIDSYGWLEYFLKGPLADKYARYIEEANEENCITPSIVVFEVYKKIRKLKDEQSALEAYAQIARTRIIELTAQLALEAAEISLTSNLGMADSMIVTTAKNYGAQIVTSDKHLKTSSKPN